MKMLWLLVALLAGACGAMTKKEPPPKPFTGTRWDVVLQLPLPGEQPWLRFGDGRMEGFGGCNQVAAEYLSDSVGARAIALRRIETGTRGCDPSARLVESRILATLQSVSSYAIEGDVMRMAGSGGTLTFKAHADAAAAPAAGTAPATASVSAPVTNAAALVGTRWVGAVDRGTPEGNVPRLELVAEGRLAGYSGCNLMNGSWTMQGNEARVGAIVTTKRACAGPEGNIEKRVLAALNEGRLVLEGGKLVAIGRSGERFEFNRVD